jgi:hypothetical protein
MKPKAFKGC